MGMGPSSPAGGLSCQQSGWACSSNGQCCTKQCTNGRCYGSRYGTGRMDVFGGEKLGMGTSGEAPFGGEKWGMGTSGGAPVGAPPPKCRGIGASCTGNDCCRPGHCNPNGVCSVTGGAVRDAAPFGGEKWGMGTSGGAPVGRAKNCSPIGWACSSTWECCSGTCVKNGRYTGSCTNQVRGAGRGY